MIKTLPAFFPLPPRPLNQTVTSIESAGSIYNLLLSSSHNTMFFYSIPIDHPPLSWLANFDRFLCRGFISVHFLTNTLELNTLVVEYDTVSKYIWSNKGFFWYIILHDSHHLTWQPLIFSRATLYIYFVLTNAVSDRIFDMIFTNYHVKPWYLVGQRCKYIWSNRGCFWHNISHDSHHLSWQAFGI